MWYRVFGADETELLPEQMLDALNQANIPTRGDFTGDDLGWTRASLYLGNEGETAVYLERYLTDEDDIREDLNTWAAWLETADYSPNSAVLMEKVIQAKQMVTLRKPIDHANESRLEDACLCVIQAIARACNGIYQIDGVGFHDSQGMCLVQEY